MEYQNELEILMHLRNQIYNERSKKAKLELLDDYFSILSYLKNLNIINADSEINKLGNNANIYLKKLNKEKVKYCSNFFENFLLIDSIVNIIMTFYQEYPLKNIKYEYNNALNEKDGIFCLYDFFGILGNDFYSLFKNMLANGHISYIPNILSEGITFTTNSGYGNYIILKRGINQFDYENLSSLAHEIGHCYEMGLLTDKKIFFLNNLLVEVTSLFIQKLFDLYNIKNNLYKEEALGSQMIWQLCVYNKTLCADFINKCISSNCIKDLNYINYNFSILYNDEMLKYLNPLNNIAFTHCTFDINNYLYIFGDYIANNLVGIYKQNPKEALILLRKFIMTYRDKTFREIISTFGKEFFETKKLIRDISHYQKERY